MSINNGLKAIARRQKKGMKKKPPSTPGACVAPIHRPLLCLLVIVIWHHDMVSRLFYFVRHLVFIKGQEVPGLFSFRSPSRKCLSLSCCC